MITIKNSQRSIPVNISHLRTAVERMLEHVGYADFDLGILLTTNATIRRYNKQFRHKDKATDILSFPFYPELKAGKRIKAQTPEEKSLGDLIISVAYAKKNIPQDLNLEEYLIYLCAHGIAHVLGYDHETDAEYDRMQKFEKKLRSGVKIKK
ncbi:MAG: rRNA maturation RNase YbeY [Candidatus Babeliales bacterium]|jgi:rRNA maturation RNase YbeY